MGHMPHVVLYCSLVPLCREQRKKKERNMAQDHLHPHQEQEYAPGNEKLSMKPSRKPFIGYGLLFGILLVPVEAALGVLSGRFSSVNPWVYGTPVCYLLFSGFAALLTTMVQKNAQERSKGHLSGLFTSLVGATLGSLVVIILVILSVISFRTSPPTCTGHCLPGPGLGLLVLIVFVPIFIIENFFSVLFGLLGGIIGGKLGSALLQKRRI